MKCYCGSDIKNLYPGRKYCSILCRSNDKSFCKKISKKKIELYSDKEWKDATEEKKIKTTRKNHGVDYPMQNVEIFEKQQASCFSKDNNGLHGYEPIIYPFLKNLYNDLKLGTTFLKENNIKILWKGIDNKNHQSYPDFFSEKLNSFIEIKSQYTYNKHYYKIMKCKDKLKDMSYGYIISIISPNKSFSFETYNLEYIKD